MNGLEPGYYLYILGENSHKGKYPLQLKMNENNEINIDLLPSTLNPFVPLFIIDQFLSSTSIEAIIKEIKDANICEALNDQECTLGIAYENNEKERILPCDIESIQGLIETLSSPLKRAQLGKITKPLLDKNHVNQELKDFIKLLKYDIEETNIIEALKQLNYFDQRILREKCLSMTCQLENDFGNTRILKKEAA